MPQVNRRQHLNQIWYQTVRCHVTCRCCLQLPHSSFYTRIYVALCGLQPSLQLICDKPATENYLKKLLSANFLPFRCLVASRHRPYYTSHFRLNSPEVTTHRTRSRDCDAPGQLIGNYREQAARFHGADGVQTPPLPPFWVMKKFRNPSEEVDCPLRLYWVNSTASVFHLT